MNKWITKLAIEAAERGWLPDSVLRAGMRRLCERRLVDGLDARTREQREQDFAAMCRRSPIALVPEKANEQHYEVSAELYSLMLGPRRKYSSCYWNELAPKNSAALRTGLAAAEEESLRLTCEHAEIEDGMSILELGCGWGSLTLWMAEHYPNSQITAVSNSASQRAYIETEAARRGVDDRLTVITCDMNRFESPLTHDRIVSVEMFEHMRNYEQLLHNISEWLAPDGKLMVHIFCHRDLSYTFDDQGAANWMGRYFFSGGIMPSARLLREFDSDLRVTREWNWNGLHYARTAEAWVANIDANRDAMLEVLSRVYGTRYAYRWLHRWRMLFLAGAELFGYRDGNEWFVSHYLFEPVRVRALA